MNQIIYKGDGQTTVFHFNFPFFQKNDIHVSIDGAVLPVGAFAINMDNPQIDADFPYNGGTIHLSNPPAFDTEIIIWRDTDTSRPIDFQSVRDMNSTHLNQDFNFCITAIQDARSNAIGGCGPNSSGAGIPGPVGPMGPMGPQGEMGPQGPAGESAMPIDADYVIEHSAAGANPWYRKYKSGWVEQGGLNISVSGAVNVTLPIPLDSDNYFPIAASGMHGVFGAVGSNIDSNGTVIRLAARNQSGTLITGHAMNWEVKGFAA